MPTSCQLALPGRPAGGANPSAAFASCEAYDSSGAAGTAAMAATAEEDLASNSLNGAVGVVTASCVNDSCRASAGASGAPTVTAVEVQAPRAVRFAQPAPSNRSYGHPSTAAGALSTREKLVASGEVTKGQAAALSELLDWADEEDRLAA